MDGAHERNSGVKGRKRLRGPPVVAIGLPALCNGWREVAQRVSGSEQSVCAKVRVEWRAFGAVTSVCAKPALRAGAMEGAPATATPDRKMNA